MKLTFMQVASTASGLLAGAATAQPAPVPASDSVLPGILPTRPGVTLDARFDTSFLDEELLLDELIAGHDEDDLDELRLVAFNLHGQYLSPIGLGVYLTMPISYASMDGDSKAELANLQFGGLYISRHRGFAAYVRGGLATDRVDFGAEPFTYVANLVSHLADAAPVGLSSYWLRLGWGLRATRRSLVLAASAGIDLPFQSDIFQKLINLQASIGYAHPSIGISGGLAMIQILDGYSSTDNNSVALQAVVDAPVGPRVRLYGAFAIGLEDNVDGVSLGVGVRAGL